MDPIETIETIERKLEDVEGGIEARLVEAKAFLVEALQDIESLKDGLEGKAEVVERVIESIGSFVEALFVVEAGQGGVDESHSTAIAHQLGIDPKTIAELQSLRSQLKEMQAHPGSPSNGGPKTPDFVVQTPTDDESDDDLDLDTEDDQDDKPKQVKTKELEVGPNDEPDEPIVPDNPAIPNSPQVVVDHHTQSDDSHKEPTNGQPGPVVTPHPNPNPAQPVPLDRQADAPPVHQEPVHPVTPEPHPGPDHPLPNVDTQGVDAFVLRQGHNVRGDSDTGAVTVVAMMANAVEGGHNFTEDTVLEDAIGNGLHHGGAAHQPVSPIHLAKELLGTQYQFNTVDVSAHTSDLADHLSQGDRVAVQVDAGSLRPGGTGQAVVWVAGTAKDEGTGARSFAIIDPAVGKVTVSEEQLQAAMDKGGGEAMAVAAGSKRLS